MAARLRIIREGDRFGRLTVLRDRVGSEVYIDVRCDCGNEVVRRVNDLGRRTNSCGCIKLAEGNPNWRGGKHSHPLYAMYNDMLARCTRPTHAAWQRYGGRGITVCDRWRNDFWAFVDDMGPRPEGALADGRAAYSIDRMDNDGPYSPGNTRWATTSEQAVNRRNMGGPGTRDETTGRFAKAAS